MKYISTRGQDGPLSFEEALLNGLARDGGLYLPVEWPAFSKAEISAMQGLYRNCRSYHVPLYRRRAITRTDHANGRRCLSQLYPPRNRAIKSHERDIHLLELFYGPTIAFKDYAMQFLSRRLIAPLVARTAMRLFWAPPAGIQARLRWKPLKGGKRLMYLSCSQRGAYRLSSKNR